MFSHPIPANLSNAWQTIITSEKPFTMDERQPNLELIWPETIAWHQEQGHLSATCACMRVGNKPIGFIGFAFHHISTLTDEQLEFIQALTNQATLSIHLTRLAEDAKQAAILQEQEKAARDRATELAKTNAALSQTLDALTTEPELDRFLGKILIQINQQIGADDAHLFLYDAKAHTLQQHIAVQQGQVFFPNAPNDPAIFRQPIPADITAAWQILLDASKPFVLDHSDSQSAEFMWPGTPDWHESRGHRTATCACMRVGHTPLGFIGFAFCNETVLTDEQLEFIQALTNQATLAIQLTRLAKQSQSVALNAALTEERNRLAREIHDTLAQAFTGVSLQLEAAKDSFTESAEDALYHVNRAGNLARQGLSEARRSVRALRSQALTTDTLPNALRTTLTEMTQDSSTTTRLRIVGTPYALPEDIQTNLLRIGQEATTNVLRHAQADTLELTLAFEIDRVHLLIIDNGIGTEASLETVEGFGLLGMRERVLRFDGHFAFTSKPGKGTVIDITIPTY
ncbi:MAG: GAF domain-containing sensor histidine kinase [Phormidesmis sp.]